MKITTIRIEDKTQNVLSEIAKTEDRSVNYIINKAIEDYVSLYQWQVEKIQESISEYEKGNTKTHEEITNRFFKKYK